MNLESLKRKFNLVSKHNLKIGLAPSFWGFAIVVGALTAPFSVATALAFAAAPAAYAGIGFACGGIAKGIDALSTAPKP